VAAASLVLDHVLNVAAAVTAGVAALTPLFQLSTSSPTPYGGKRTR
jgi:hypothetical protein